MNYPGAAFDTKWRQLLKPSDYQNPSPADRYHLVVVGAGPAGLIAAIGAAGLGARVALVEKHLMGGDCLNVGCVPSKALLEYTFHEPNPTFHEAFSWLREVRAGIAPHDSVTRYTEAGVDVFLGEGAFVDGKCIRVGDAQLRGRSFALCTGALSVVPPIPGLREANPLTNETIFDLKRMPRSIAILGGGPIGCELAQVFARLGIEVHIFEMLERLLAVENVAASQALESAMSALGVKMHLGQAVERVIPDPEPTVCAGQTQVQVDVILVALGRKPNTSALKLEAAGVEVDKRGKIIVNSRLQTSNKQIFAAGDCAADLQFTHHADAQARILVQNALFLPTATVDQLVVPRCTYTQPEVASVGNHPTSLTTQGIAFDVYRVEFSELDRGRTEREGSGFAEVYCRKGSDTILGATIVGHDAGEQLAPLCLLMSNGLGLGAALKTIMSYPTRAEYLKRLADAYNRTRLTPMVAGLMHRWLQWRL